jgi:hypothetical protein
MSEQIQIDQLVRDRLREASTATIATQLFRMGLRNQFLNDRTIVEFETGRRERSRTTR